VTDQEGLDTRALHDALETGYIVAHGTDSLAPASWRAWCRDGACPCVIVHRAGRLARVEVDLTTAGWWLTDAGLSRIAGALTRWRMSAVSGATLFYAASASFERADGFVAALLQVLADPTSTSAA
jgi:GTPase